VDDFYAARSRTIPPLAWPNIAPPFSVRNVPLARTIFATAGVNELVPPDHFDAIAEIILWARRARAGQAPLEREDIA